MLVSEGLGARAVARCEALRDPPFSEAEGLLDRPYLTPAHAATLDKIRAWMEAAGLQVRRDALATLIGRYEGLTPGAPALVIASHVDSVRDGGAFDGMLGVLLGLACVETLAEERRRLSFAIEVAAFGDEEGSRFPAAMNASRAFIGERPDLEARDAAGVSVKEALVAFGAAAPTQDAARARSEILAFLEPHIEQGPALEAAGAPLGVVTAIAGQIRLQVRLSGQAGHAGTTPMALRRDALAAAAEIVLGVEAIARAGAADLVATVGRIAVRPGAPNVVPGGAEFTVDIRAGADDRRDAALGAILRCIETVAAARGVEAAVTRVQDLPATPMDARLTDLLGEAVAERGFDALRLVSGAGHDAMILARFAPAAMLFIRCAGGLSHHRDESVRPEDGQAALEALMAFLHLLERERRP